MTQDVIVRADGDAHGRWLCQGAVVDERIEEQRLIRAEPAEVFAVLRDPRGHVAIDSSGMLMAATGEPVNAVGDSFVVHMDREALGDLPLGEYDVTVTITAYDPDREIAWKVLGRLRPQIGHVYGYRLEPVGGRHQGDVLLRLVGHGPGVARARPHLPDRARLGVEGNARHPGADGLLATDGLIVSPDRQACSA